MFPDNTPERRKNQWAFATVKEITATPPPVSLACLDGRKRGESGAVGRITEPYCAQNERKIKMAFHQRIADVTQGSLAGTSQLLRRYRCRRTERLEIYITQVLAKSRKYTPHSTRTDKDIFPPPKKNPPFAFAHRPNPASHSQNQNGLSINRHVHRLDPIIPFHNHLPRDRPETRNMREEAGESTLPKK